MPDAVERYLANGEDRRIVPEQTIGLRLRMRPLGLTVSALAASQEDMEVTLGAGFID